MSGAHQTVEVCLPIWGTAKATLRLLAAGFRDLTVATAGLFPLYYAAALVSAGSPSATIDALALLVGLLVMAVVSVAWYRSFLLGEPAALLRRLSPVHLRMGAMTLVLSLLTYGPLWLAEPIFPPEPADNILRELALVAVFAAVIFLTLYLFVRLFMVFPAIALSASFELRDALRASARNGGRLLLISLLLALPAVLLLVAADILFEAPLEESNTLSVAYGLGGPGIDGVREAAYVLLQSLLHFVLAALTAALAAIAFTRLTDLAPPLSGTVDARLS